MAGENTVASLNGLFKVVYADKLLDLVPDYAVLQKRVTFTQDDKSMGSYYAQPINLTQEGGFTYNGSSGGVVSLAAPVNGTMNEAQVKGSELILRAQLSYLALTRSTTSQKAFKKATAWKVLDMNNSMRKRLEIAMLYGQQGVGTVSSVTAGVITITPATWAGGIWAGTEGQVIEAWSGLTGSDTQHNGDLSITSVDADNKTVTVQNASNLVVAGDILFFKGSRTSGAFNEMAGLKKIITNAGTLFNISAASYSLWKGSTYAVSAQLSHAAIQKALAKAVNKGLMEKVSVLISPNSWSTLNTDQAALRVYDRSFDSKKGENGFQSLSFYSTNGVVEIISHPMVKDGDGFVVPEDSLRRLGSTDVTFQIPGSTDEFFLPVSGYNAVEMQCMTDQAIFLERPAHTVYLSSITP